MIRIGNIVYYEDVKDCGYPITIKINPESWSFDKVIRTNPDGHEVRIHPMEFRFHDFWTDNSHLMCNDYDLPDDIKYLHDFMNWYEDKFLSQPVIKRGGNPL